jgi:putative peptidoglycan lipid II flippase
MVAPSTPSSAPSAPVPERLARSASLTGLATLVSRVLGLARETVAAAIFGAGNEMDAFLVAFRVPNLIRDLFAEGAMSAAFVPTFTRHLAIRGKEDAWRLGRNVLTTLAVVTGAVVLLMWLFAEPLVRIYAGDFAMVPGKLALTVHLARIMLPFLVLVALAAAAMGMLNALHHYFLPALAPAAFNVASIVCALTLIPVMRAVGEPPIAALAVGALLGGFGQLALQWPALRGEGFRYRPQVDLRDPGLRQMMLLMGPGTVGLAATQVNLFVTTLLAAQQGPGAVSWLQYAFRLMYLPIGLFGVSIATAVLPAVSRHLAVDDAIAAGRTVTRGLAMMLVVNIPATVGLFMLAAPIVEVLLERCRFHPADTVATAAAVRCYAAGLIGYSTARIASPVFYALGRSRLAVALSITSMVANLAFSLVLVRPMGHSGLALATSLAALLNGALALTILARQTRVVDVRHLFVTMLKTALAAAIMAAALTALVSIVSTVAPGDRLAPRAVRLAIDIGGGLAAFTVAAHLLRIAEFDQMRRRAAARALALVGRASDPPQDA